MKEHKVTKAGIFGSYARDKAEKESDLDIIVDFKPEVDLFDRAGAQLDLEEKTGGDVDLITFDSLKEELEPYVYSDLKIF